MDQPKKTAAGKLYKVLMETLPGSDASLTTFRFLRGGNFYVFSYLKDGLTRHTLIDTGDSFYENQILTLLTENGVTPSAIERIIITHSHPDHSGSAYVLARESGAKILVHAKFRSYVESEPTLEERVWMGKFSLSRLKGQDVSYISPSNSKNESINIGGVDFPKLGEPIEIGAGKLLILASPKGIPTHSPDQIIIVYLVGSNSSIKDKKQGSFLPMDDMLFSGDLWLMEGPAFRWGIRRRIRFVSGQTRRLLTGKGLIRLNFIQQDMEAREALKRGFCLLRVKPGHGDEFIGSRILPQGLLADRDLLLALGYSLNDDISILKAAYLAPRIADLKEKAYAGFVRELLLWGELGYKFDDMSNILLRIYAEQSGGGTPMVREDRRERRVRFIETLKRLKNDESRPEALRKLAEFTLPRLRKVH